jgi:hypothetical protein
LGHGWLGITVVLVSERCQEITVRIHLVVFVDYVGISVRIKWCGLFGNYCKDKEIGWVWIIWELVKGKCEWVSVGYLGVTLRIL